MMTELLDAIVRAHPWTVRFTRYEYREAFQEYSRRYAPLYAAAAQTEDVSVLAGEIIDALAQHRAGLHFWNRGAATAEQKTVTVCYLTPMLLQSVEPHCRELAYALCEKWREKWPTDAYEAADFATLADGFRRSIMGIDLANKHLNKDRDR